MQHCLQMRKALCSRVPVSQKLSKALSLTMLGNIARRRLPAQTSSARRTALPLSQALINAL